MAAVSPQNSITLLHISDIHFKEPECLGNDPSRHYRSIMIRDVISHAKSFGQIGAILLTGDIAFKAHHNEYKAAWNWLKEWTERTGCPLERVFCVPGNHDVDRKIISTRVSVRNAQHAIKSAADQHKDAQLSAQLSDADAARALLLPLAAYNDFAAPLNCQVYPEKLGWRQDIELAEGGRLRINGLTSTLLSGVLKQDGKQDDIKGELFMGKWQTAIDIEENVIQLAMAHHPPDWLLDGDDVQDALNNRSQIHLFGHKHRQRHRFDDQYVVFEAGAVNPSDQEPHWQPACNLIRLSVESHDAGRVLCVEVKELNWQNSPDAYVCKQAPGGAEVFTKRLPFPASNHAPSIQPTVLVPAGPVLTEVAIQSEVEMGAVSTRRMLLQLWELPLSARREIVAGLDLLSEAEMALPEPERYGKALLRASERGLLVKLGDAIQEWRKNE